MHTKRLRRRVRRAIDYLKAAHIDLRLWLTGKTDPEIPPLRLQIVGFGDFRRMGEELARLLIGAGGLRPADRVLDIGCGIGRVALPLTRYLQPPATYDGFDVMKAAIRWCDRHITADHPNFRFHHVDVSSSEYSSGGVAASEFRFPFADASFDFAFATSVFTHLVEEETKRYLAESARVLVSGGRFLATFFLLNDFSLRNLPTRAGYTFPFERGSMRLLDADNSAFGVALRENFVVALLRDAGFEISRIDYGEWSGRPSATSFQDVVVCRRL
jgi:SAM-dependent methyltransferase